MGKNADERAHNVIATDSKGVVVSVLRGRQTGESIRALGTEVQKRIQTLHDQGKKALLLADIRAQRKTDVTSSERLETKRMLDLPFDAAAILTNRGLLALAMYSVRIVGGNPKMRFFTSERKARAWLENARHPKSIRPSVSLIAGIFIALIGVLALIGWQINGQYLMRGLTLFKPMNPVAAVGLLAAGYGFTCYYFGRLKQLKVAGVFGVLLGVAALLPLHIDTLLFAHKVAAFGADAQLTYTAAICFIAVGLSPFTVGTNKLWVRVLQYVLGTTILGLSVVTIFGQLYAHEFLYSLGSSFVMAFNLAVAFLAVGATLILIILYRRVGNVLGSVTRTGWLIVAALIFVQVATYGAWSQTVTHNQSNSSEAFLSRGEDIDSSLSQRIQAYINALYGFKGLFLASDYVDQGEFQAYYNSLNLNTTYPGLRTLSFISEVQEKDLPAFVARHRADTSLNPGGNPGFAITAKSNLTTHYIVTYASTATTGGNDLGSNPDRLAAFQKAAASRQPTSSGTVQFAASNATPAQSGFFITIPVANKASAGQTVGFVNAVFSYQDFFAHAFVPPTLLDGLTTSIADTADNTTVYASTKGGSPALAAYSRIVDLPVADHMWSVRLSAPADFGISSTQSMLPRTILIGGQLFALLLVVIFVLQARARRQGFELADSITEDLERERNRAVASDQKSGAILSSIGDAVFAVDTKLRITLFNPSASRISGFTEAEALGKPYHEVLKFEFEKTGRPNNTFIHQALTGHLTSMANHTVLTRKDGTRIPVADSAAPISDTSHKVRGAIVVFRDVTKDYELDKAKSEFVSLASHQLRTPLSAINWYGEMLLSGDAGKLNKDQHEYVKEISDGNHRMVELVDALLDVSRLEVGKLVNQPADTDIARLIDSLEKELAFSIKEKQIRFTKDIHSLPPVFADPKRLRMVVQNLLSNAVKYTPDKGAVAVSLRRADASDLAAAHLSGTHPYLMLTIKDTGYGIPQEQQSKIFSKLFRADNVRRLNVEGTGLGLYIVKEVVTAIGGRVWFDSIESAGTTFYVVLPIDTRHHVPVRKENDHA